MIIQDNQFWAKKTRELSKAFSETFKYPFQTLSVICYHDTLDVSEIIWKKFSHYSHNDF